jgi:hypothetical protein
MRMPGFTAEASFSRVKKHYKTTVSPNLADQSLYQAQSSTFDLRYRGPDLLTNWPIYVLGRPILEPSCICLRLDSQGKCIRQLCF